MTADRFILTAVPEQHIKELIECKQKPLQSATLLHIVLELPNKVCFSSHTLLLVEYRDHLVDALRLCNAGDLVGALCDILVHF